MYIHTYIVPAHGFTIAESFNSLANIYDVYDSRTIMDPQLNLYVDIFSTQLIYRYIWNLWMSSIFGQKTPPKQGPNSNKARVIWVPGIFGTPGTQMTLGMLEKTLFWGVGLQKQRSLGLFLKC